MKNLTLIIVFLFSFNKVQSQIPPTNNNIKILGLQFNDKDLHAIISNGITAGCGYTMYHFTNKIGLSILTGGLTSLTIGAGKELIYDGYFHKGIPNKWDFFYDAGGTIGGCLQLRVEIDMERKSHPKSWLYDNNYYDFSDTLNGKEPILVK